VQSETTDPAQCLLGRVNDPALKAEADKRGYEMDPVAGEKLESLAKEVIAQPPAVIERMKTVWDNSSARQREIRLPL
jgi:hypothetical protein